MLKFVDLFCGGGFGGRGAVSAGGTPLLGVDSWDIAIDTYKSKIDVIAKDSIKKIKEIHANYTNVESGIVDDTIENLESKNDK